LAIVSGLRIEEVNKLASVECGVLFVLPPALVGVWLVVLRKKIIPGN
jgi:hypothetical protein